jgi:hypothetical protein
MTRDIYRNDEAPITKRKALEWLNEKLTFELGDRATSVPDEFVAVEPVRGTELYRAVQAVEKHFGGRLPVKPWTAWRGMLLRADLEQGEADLHERYGQFYVLADTLHQWVKTEIFELDSQPKRPKRRGRKPTSDVDEDERLKRDWESARGCGTLKSEFCRARGISTKELDRALGRVRKRRNSAD